MGTVRRFDAHCHVFDLHYLVLEAGQMLWDAMRGRYPTRGLSAKSDGLRERIERLVVWLNAQARKLVGPEEANLKTALAQVESTWPGCSSCSIPLMMDIYYMFDAPLGEDDVLSPHRPTKGTAAAASPDDLEKRLRQLGTAEEFTRKIVEGVQQVKAEGAGPFDTLGFKHHLAALRKLATEPTWKGRVFPFLAIDPRRDGAIDAVVKGNLVGVSGPFYGIKLYPRLGYHANTKTLRPLYDWCSGNSIPITAHCSPGGFRSPFVEYPELGRPECYREVLKGRPGLRIDLAHFGGGDPAWRESVRAFMREHPEQVFSDLSCYSGHGEPAQFRAWLDSTSTPWSELSGRVMFGTDFDVMGLTDVDMSLDLYYQQFTAPGAFTADELRAMASTVPTAFLGLQD